jgi:hypothetical protein
MSFTTDWFDLSDGAPETVQIIRSLLPVFTYENERPQSLGTCVLVRIEGRSFVLTAAHVIAEAQMSRRRFAVAIGGKLVTLHHDAFVSRPEDPSDIGLIPLRDRDATLFSSIGGVFLDEEMIDETEEGDGLDVLNMLEHTYFAVGFPASKSYSWVRQREGKIRVKSHTTCATLAPTRSYPEGLSQDKHILLDYDRREIVVEGRSVTPPTTLGMSGGGIFRFRRRQLDTIRLVGILIEYHKDANVMAGTRASVAMDLGREVVWQHPDAFR